MDTSVVRLLFISLGCDKNLVDSEKMLALLNDQKYQIIDSEDQADVIIINTCCFINDAKVESINTILQMAEYKKTAVCKAIIVTGCLAQRYKEEIFKEIPEVDAVIGTNSYDMICDAVKSVLDGKKYTCFNALNGMLEMSDKRILSAITHYSNLKIAEGCNKRCTYCIIPYIRGDYRSFDMERLVEEAAQLGRLGVKELILVAQETTLYGIDIYGKKMLPELLNRLSKVEGIEWIRLLYCYPEEITDELIETIASNEKVCKYIDMPIQHASDNILKRMGRKTSRQDIVDIVTKLKKKIPNIAIRTTLITGFPGETIDDYHILYEFVKEMRFERLGVFTYSPEENTKAALMENQISERAKNLRRNKIMKLQQSISRENNLNRIGQKVKVIIDGKLSDENVYVCRSYMEAPNIDSNIFVEAEYELISGDILEVIIIDADEYDLIGKIVRKID